MPRSKEGHKKPPIDVTNMKAAVRAKLIEGLSYGECCKTFNVKKTTLHRQVENFRKKHGNITDSIISENYKYVDNWDTNRIFSLEEETELVAYIQAMARMHYGLSKKRLRYVVYKFAIANEKRIPQNWTKDELAGIEWLRMFQNRHKSQISLRKPEATSLSRATSFNRRNIEAFFKNLTDVHDRYGPFHPENIYNVDETGLTTVQTPVKVYATKGEKQVGSVSSAERGQLVTMIGGINALGNQIPPFLIFPRVNYKEFMIHGAPPGTDGAATRSGWSCEETFEKYLRHFIRHSKASKDNKVLLVLDNHESHCGPHIIKLARESGIILLTLVPHTSNKTQPLDRTVFGPLKTYYNEEIDLWLHNNPGRTFGIYDIAGALGKVYAKAFCNSNIVQGFICTGIYPINPNIFTDADYLCSSVTDRSNPELEPSSSGSPALTSTQLSTSKSAEVRFTPDQPTTSSDQISTSLEPNRTRKKQKLSPEDVCPFPKAGPRKKTTRGRKPGATRILTITPDKPTTTDKSKTTAPSCLQKPKLKPISLFSPKKGSSSTDDSSSDSDDIGLSLHGSDSVEESFTESDDENVQGNEVEIGDLKADDYVVFKLLYDANTKRETEKYFIAQVTNVNISSDTIMLNVMRKKGVNYHFPTIQEERKVTRKHIVQKLTKVSFRRGYLTITGKLDFPIFM